MIPSSRSIFEFSFDLIFLSLFLFKSILSIPFTLLLDLILFSSQFIFLYLFFFIFTNDTFVSMYFDIIINKTSQTRFFRKGLNLI